MKVNKRMVGTVSRGIRCPIIREGDDLAAIVTGSVLAAAESEGFALRDRDIVAVTESVVARAQGNYCTVKDIARDVRTKLGGGTVGVLFPILSRNRFSTCLRGIAAGSKKVIVMLSYPSDEVGNELVSQDKLDEAGVDPWTDVLTEADFRRLFGESRHPFTGMDYIAYYRSLIEESGAEAEIIFGNHAGQIVPYTDHVIACDIHTRMRSKKKLIAAGAKVVLTLDELMNAPLKGSKRGYNADYGLLGSNKAAEDTVKLFPRDAQPLVDDIQQLLLKATGKKIEVMVYGDGAFKDPQGKIWEFADPVVAPFHTAGLTGTPNELKLKYLADNQFGSLKGEELEEAIRDSIRQKDADLVGQMVSEGTTPRRLTDLIGSLCDLTSGSGDKGTPIVLIQGYFDNYTDD